MIVINANCLDWMKTQLENSIDCIITDPPYGLAFMGKKWDYQLPEAEIWKEALRICKPGSWLLAFGGSRTHHRLTCSIEDAEWEIRDCLMWMHGQGFPKGKGCLKPAYEPIILARKRAPKPELNIDNCRIEGEPWKSHNATGLAKTKFFTDGETAIIYKEPNSNGRWPTNVILDETSADLLDQQSGQLSQCGGKKKTTHSDGCFGIGTPQKEIWKEEYRGASRFFYCAKASTAERNLGCEKLPLKEISGCYGEFEGDGRGRQTEHKPSKNNHPTVKPRKLMEYLIKLVAPKDGILLDPFAGSGTTLIAAKKLGYKAIGIEVDPEYCKIAEARIAAQECQMELDL